MINELNFNLSALEIEQLANKQFALLDKSLKELASQKDPLGFISLDLTLAEFSNHLGTCVFLKYVSPDPAIRNAADQVETKMQKLMVDVFAREDLFELVQRGQTVESSLNATQKELLEDYLFQFKKNGLGLPSGKRQDFLEKKKHLVEIESEFSQNLLKENTVLEFTQEELKGLPESFLESLSKTPEGKYQVTLSYPHVTPFMENVVNAEARRQLSFQFNNRGGARNKALLEEATQLRHELAQTLGFSSHAALVLSRRMALTPEKVEHFLKDLYGKLKPIGVKERQTLLDLKKELLKDPTPLTSFEWRFLHNQLLKKNFQVDPLQIQEYFPLDTVLKGLFQIYQTLLAVEFREDLKAATWHPLVKKYQVWKSGKLVSHFYMDLFPRAGKYNHAAAFTLVSGYQQKDGSYQLPFSSIVANFSSPTADKPSLLLHTEVETLFHEFGHIMHQVLTTAHYPSFSGTGVKTDFVEAPSQMFENWVWDENMLLQLSGHYLRPNEKLPKALIAKMLAAKNLNQGLHYLRQLAFGFIDLEIHTRAQCDSTEVYQRTMKEILEIPILEGTMPQASFGHLMGGYDAGYYGYLWAEVFAQDMFTRFEKEGLLNTETGKDYRTWILEPGGEKPPMELLKGFLKREPNADAFIKGLGI